MFKRKKNKTSINPGHAEQYKAVMRVWDLRGYLLFWLITFLGLMILSAVNRGGLKEQWYVYLLFAMFAVVFTLIYWFFMWLIFGLLAISPARTTINQQGLRVQNAYGSSSDVSWDDIVAVKTVSMPFLSQLVYLQAKNHIIYCMGKRYRDHGRFLHCLDSHAPAAHPLRLFFL